MADKDRHDRLPRTVRSFLCLAVLSFAAASLGCGIGNNSKGSASVSGTVKYEGTPLPTGTVTFFNSNKEIVGSATIKDGSYTMQGLPAGKVMVTVATPPAVKPNTTHAPKDMPGDPPLPVVPIPAKYGNPQQSGLSYDVKLGSQEYPIDLR